VVPKETKKRAARNEGVELGPLGQIKLLYPVLGSCMLDRNDAPEGEHEDKAERFYDSALQALEVSKDYCFAACEFSAGKRIKETKIIEIRATYFIAFDLEQTVSVSDEDRRQMLWQMAESAAWPMFRDLFIHIGSQSGEELPLLPNVPKLRWLKSSEETKKSE
jgi:hypothetical protein